MIVLLVVTQNEADLLRWNLAHHLSWGVDRVAVADNRSTDATPDVVREFGSAVALEAFSDFHTRQSVRLRMLRQLLDTSPSQIDWAGICDTDEFFWAPCGGMPDLLRDVPDDIVAVNFDAKLFLPTALDPDREPVLARRTFCTIAGDNPLHTSYAAGKTFYRAAWLATLPLDHWCKNHEHWCLEVPHVRWRHPESAVHHYMVQDENQFVDKVRRLIAWARPPDGALSRVRWRLRPARKRDLPRWSEPWKKEWWAVYQRSGEEGLRSYYRTRYTISAPDVARYLAEGKLLHDDGFSELIRERADALS